MKMMYCRGCTGYTLKQECPKCGKAASSIGPARYSPQDPYGKYRRQMKKELGQL
ncbi:RNA-protein complex protein Nop10 [Candidatus Altiarchaeota archaeon]